VPVMATPVVAGMAAAPSDATPDATLF
jgi:hypothetical protein